MHELAKERAILLANLEEWRKLQMGNTVLIHGDEVVGFFDTLSEAIWPGTIPCPPDPS
jgi:hypothetical protein